MFLKLISFLGWGILLCLLLTFSVAISVWLNWATPYALLLWAALIVLTILLRAVGLYLLRLYHEGKITSLFSRHRLTRMERVLLEQWNQGLAVVRRIVRRKHALPWFVLMGKQCGKTTLVAGAGLPIVSARTEHEPIVPTRTLRWSFFKTIAFLDLSSHFLLKSPAYERAWRHLTRWCRRQPPAGVIVCLSVADLLRNDAMQLHLDARQIRAQLEPLTRSLGRHLPIYILITCCDEIPGFSAWVRQLSPAQSQQALGHHWDRPPIMDSKDPACLNDLFNALRKGMDLARVAMASSLNSDAEALPVLDFPEKISQLQPALNHYLSALAQPDAYFEPGMLGGVWFTASERLSQHSQQRRSLFMHELVSRHLPMLSHYHRRALADIHYRSRRLGRRFLMLLCLAGLGSSAVMSASLFAWQPKALSRDELVNQLERNESWHQSVWRYLPFIPLLDLQHQWLENRLLQQTPQAMQNTTAQLASYQQRVMTAVPDEQYRLIMQLAQSIVSEQNLRQGMLLVDAKQQPPIPVELRITGMDDAGSTDTELALERALLNQAGSDSRLTAQRQLLRRLMESNPQWLFAADSHLSTVSAGDFGFKSDSSQRLDGIWTRQGSDEIHARAALVMQALAQSKLEPVLDTQLQRLPELRQSHWLQWLLALSHEGFHVDGSQSRQALLMDIDRGNSPAMRLARAIHEDLADLNDAQAQPWLQELRYLQQLQQQATQAVYLGKLSRLDQKLRQKTASVLKNTGGTTPRAFNPSMAASWLAWRSSERHATAAALAAPEKSLMLIGGLFAPQDTPTDNAIRQMYSRFEQLRQSISPERDDYAINVLWSLYQSDADLLLAHAINSAACEVQQRWQQQVLWPLTNNNQQQTPDDPFMLASQSVQNFMRGTAKGLLDMTQGEAQAARFRGQALPLTPEFLSLVNHVLRPDDVLATPLSTESKNQDELARLDEQQKTLIAQKTALESQSVDVTLNSQPATVPGMARIMPTGTKLTLTCDDQSVTLASMNFSEQARFHWRPAHCSHVELVIRFPQFDLHYDYLGDAAWPNFLRDFSQGQHTFSADEFDDQQIQLRALGISNILVRYQLSDWAPTQQAWGLWQQTTEQLNQTNEQRTALQNAQAQRQQPRLTGNLSQVPTTVAQCSN